jgi:hypothetical protein
MMEPSTTTDVDAVTNGPEALPPTTAVEELVYTSAPKLLNSTAAHLGVVARSKAFPSEVETAVSKQWAYSMPAALGLPESQTLPRFYLLPAGMNQRWTTLSRVQSAGFDHTGRTTPIAQHFAVDGERLRACAGSVASLVGWASRHYAAEHERIFCDRWDDEPKELTPRQLDTSVGPSPYQLLESIPPACGATLEDIRNALFATVETLRAYPSSQRMAVIVIRPSFAPYVLSFLGAVLAALPKAVQSGVTATSHVWELSDAPANYTLAFTYPRSPYFERIKERADSKKPVIIDLALKVPAIPPAASDYAAFVRSDCEHWGEQDWTSLPHLFDEIDPSAKHSATVFAIKRLLDEWSHSQSYFAYDALVQGVSDAARAGLPQADSASLLRRIGLTSVEKFFAAADWNTLYETFVAAAFPGVVRERAWDAIRASFAQIVASSPELLAQRILEPTGDRVIALLADHDDAVDVLLQRVEARARGLSSPESHALASRWAVLGTQVLGRIWRQMASDLAGGVTPSQFYRRVLDKLIPKATVPDAVPAGANGGSSQQPTLGLEALLRPAWSIVSRQVRAGAKPDPLCFIVLDRLMGLAVVPGVNSRPAGLAGDRRPEGVSGGIGSRTAEQIPFVDDSVLKLDLFGS